METRFVLFCFALLLLSTEQAPAQMGNPSSRFAIGIFYNPSINTYSVYGDTNYGSDAIVKNHTGHNYGILSNYNLSKRWSVQSGVGVSDFGYEMQYSGRGYPNGLYRFKVGYIEVPLEFRMIVTSPVKRLKVIGSIGGFIAFLTKDKRGSPEFISGTTQINLTNFDNFSIYAPILGGLNIGAVLSYSYSNRVEFEFQPVAKIFSGKNTYSSIPGDDQWTHISSIGFRFSIVYKI